mgnify:CR=1 FL=1
MNQSTFHFDASASLPTQSAGKDNRDSYAASAEAVFAAMNDAHLSAAQPKRLNSNTTLNSASTPVSTLHAPENTEEQRVSQLSLPSNTSACRYLLPGMLKELNNSSDDRWLCWVAQQPVKALMRAGQGKTQEQNRVLQIVSREPHPELLRLASRALSTGKSHTVILVLDYQPSSQDIAELEAAAQNGGSECLVVIEL